MCKTLNLEKIKIVTLLLHKIKKYREIKIYECQMRKHQKIKI